MNGDFPMRDRVFGSRKGASGGTASRQISTTTPTRPTSANRSPRDSSGDIS